MERERDYSMMITKRLPARGQSHSGNKHRAKKCRIKNIETGEVLTFDSAKEIDEHFKMCHGRAGYAARNNQLMGKVWKVEVLKDD